MTQKTKQPERNGWIRLWRELKKKPVWIESKKDRRLILITLLLMVCYEKEDATWSGKPIILKPGSMVTSLDEIREEAAEDISIQSVRSALDKFENVYEFITQKTTNTGRMITILNWNKYQQDGKTSQQTEEQRENADKLYLFYIEKIEPTRKTRVRAVANILKHSKKHSFKNMALAVVNYKPDALSRDPEFRKDPANFFGVNDPYFRAFLPGNYKKDVYTPTPVVILTDEKLKELNS